MEDNETKSFIKLLTDGKEKSGKLLIFIEQNKDKIMKIEEFGKNDDSEELNCMWYVMREALRHKNALVSKFLDKFKNNDFAHKEEEFNTQAQLLIIDIVGATEIAILILKKIEKTYYEQFSDNGKNVC